jgi:hypothetical protein
MVIGVEWSVWRAVVPSWIDQTVTLEAGGQWTLISGLNFEEQLSTITKTRLAKDNTVC